MQMPYINAIKVLMVALSVLAANTFAQNSAPTAEAKKIESTAQTPTADLKTTAVKKAEPKSDANPTQPAKKMVQDASITLQTTITGNQEQPRVLYILPWQSPIAASVDFESLDNEQKAVFGHVEREELRRELESSDEVK